MYLQRAGDAVYVAGVTRAELGASEFHRLLARRRGEPGAFGGAPPSLDPPAALALYRAMNAAAARGLLRSSHTPSLGGLATAFALAALGGDLGLEIDLAAAPGAGALSDDEALFSESNSRFVLTCAPADAPELERVFAGQPVARVGRVTDAPRLVVRSRRGRPVLDAALDRLRRAFQRTLRGL
jgi:phosphoribosylformylglycinamidine synthase